MDENYRNSHAIVDLLWETLHHISGATGRTNNAAFVDLFLNICEQINPEASFEIGAHGAEFSQELRRRQPQIASYAFEANPYVFKHFQPRVSGGVVYVNRAVGSDTAPRQFYIPKTIPRAGRDARQLPNNNHTSSLRLRRAEGVEYEEVTCECSTLDAVHEDLQWPTSVVWIDVEGATGDVLRGAVHALERSIKCIFVEVETRPLWDGQWVAEDVVEFMEEAKLLPLARDAETPCQYNQIFIRERDLTPRIIALIRAYLDQLQMTHSARPPSGAASATLLKRSAPAAALPSPALVRKGCASGPHDGRSRLGAFLVDNDLLQPNEVQQYLRNFILPQEFAHRVLNWKAPAESATSAEGLESREVVPAEPAEPVIPSTPVIPGRCPTELRHPARFAPVALHEALAGKVFVGKGLTTLILGDNRYFAGVSTPASRWIAPAFASAPGELAFEGTVAILYADGATLFSHWMFDLIPKLEVLRRAGWTPDRVDHYVVNARRSTFQVETLKRLGISNEKIVVAGGRVISADRLLIPTHIRNGFRTPPWVRKFVNELFIPAETKSHNPKSERLRLYISRAHARCRRILNEDDVRAILEPAGFQTVFAEQYSIAEFARLISQSQQVVAPHGAGVTNVVFASPNIQLLETYSAHIAAEGWLMTSDVGGRHYALAGKDELGRYPWEDGAYAGFSRTQRNDADYFIDPGDLERALEMISDS